MLLICLLLLVPITVRSTDEAQEIEIQFDGMAPKKYPLKYIKYSQTINNLIEDTGLTKMVGQNLLMPINVTQETFDCFIDYAKELYDKGNCLEDARKTFQKIKRKYPKVLTADLLIQTNYLDPQINVFDKVSSATISFKSLITFLYANSLKTNFFTITEDDQKNLILDNLPHELEPLARDWILHNLLKEFEMDKFDVITEKSYPYVFKNSFQPALCSSATKNGFGYVWNHTYKQSGWKKPHGFYVDFAKNELVDIHIPVSWFNPMQCALSSDATYLLLTVGGNVSQQTKFIIYNIKNKKVEKQISATINEERINSVLFNTKKSVFNIITIEKAKNDNQKSAFTCYQLDLNKNNSIIEKLGDNVTDVQIENYISMRWSCIQGQLVGFSHLKDAILFDTDEKKFFTCFERNDGSLFYNETGKERITNISIIRGAILNYLLATAVFETSTIPFFTEIVANIVKKKVKKLPEYKGAYFLNFLLLPQAKVDLNHFHIHFVDRTNNTLNISYFFDPRLIESLQVLRKAEGGLADAYFLFQYYMNPTKWYIKCKNLINPAKMLISPTIQKIYGLDQLTTSPLQYKATSFWDAYKQGKLWSYTQQRWKSFYNRYETPILGGAAVLGTTAFISWLLRKSEQLPAEALNVRPHTP